MMRVHHVGYLVKKMDKARKHFLFLGFRILSEVVYDPYRDVDICFMEKDGYVVELVNPKSKASVAAGLLKQYRNSPYHICYESDDFDGDILAAENNGFLKFDEPCPAPALNNKRVCFLMSPGIGMIEILES